VKSQWLSYAAHFGDAWNAAVSQRVPVILMAVVRDKTTSLTSLPVLADPRADAFNESYHNQ
jgi:hypothetical protein